MLFKSVKIIDSMQNVVATAKVQYIRNYYSGEVNLDLTPKLLLSQFQEYESIVNDGIFSLFDRIEE
jgi:hypothetical protein